MNQTENKLPYAQSLPSHLFARPSDEVVKFFTGYLGRASSESEVKTNAGQEPNRIIVPNCGVADFALATKFGCELFGSNESKEAIEALIDSLKAYSVPTDAGRFVCSSPTKLPWSSGYFDHAIYDNVFDCLSFADAQVSSSEAARLIKPQGYLYCSLASSSLLNDTNLISQKDDGLTPGFTDLTELVYDYIKIKRLLEPFFVIIDCYLIQVQNPIRRTNHARWHVYAQRR